MSDFDMFRDEEGALPEIGFFTTLDRFMNDPSMKDLDEDSRNRIKIEYLMNAVEDCIHAGCMAPLLCGHEERLKDAVSKSNDY